MQHAYLLSNHNSILEVQRSTKVTRGQTIFMRCHVVQRPSLISDDLKTSSLKHMHKGYQKKA